MLTKHNAVGYAVLAALCNKMTDDEWPLTTVEPYLNGRESGFAVVLRIKNGSRKKCVFSESRHSDEIVVYSDHENAFGFNNSLTEVIYGSGARFGCGQYTAAAAYILVQLRETK